MADVKITKAMVLKAVMELVEGMQDAIEVDGGAEVTAEDITAYCEITLDQLARKAGKAAERAAEKKVQGDELYATVISHLTDEFQTGDVITELIADPEVTKSKVVSRLSQAVKNGIAVKEQQKVGDKKVMTYRLAESVPTVEAE